MREEENEFEEVDDASLDGSALDEVLKEDLIEEWCPECKAMRPHAMVRKGRIACAECNHEHDRETEDNDVPVHFSLIREDERENPDLLREAWERLTESGHAPEAKPYSIRATFDEGDIVKHVKFGVGIAIKMIDSTKVEILFKDGLHLLVCGK